MTLTDSAIEGWHHCEAINELNDGCALIPEKIVSVHVPKTGGSSLHSQFAILLDELVVLDVTHDPLTIAGSETAAFPRGKRILHGHFRALRYASVDAYWLTFLRHPVDNLISTYFYWKSFTSPAQHLHARFLREKPSILELAAYPGIQRQTSETYFGGFDMGRFDFIGFHETRDADVPRLGKVIGLPLSAKVHINKSDVTDERREIEADLTTRNHLSDLLSDDIKFYERLRRRGW